MISNNCQRRGRVSFLTRIFNDFSCHIHHGREWFNCRLLELFNSRSDYKKKSLNIFCYFFLFQNFDSISSTSGLYSCIIYMTNQWQEYRPNQNKYHNKIHIISAQSEVFEFKLNPRQNSYLIFADERFESITLFFSLFKPLKVFYGFEYTSLKNKH